MTKPIDLSKLPEKYSGQWIALSPDENSVVGASMDFDEALKQAHAKGIELPLIVKSPIPELWGPFFE